MNRTYARVFLLFLAALPIFMLTGCKQTLLPDSGLEDHGGSYAATATITYQDFSATATLSQESPQSCAVVFTSPESLKDMSMVFWKDKVDLSYKNASVSFRPESIPGSAAAQVAVSAINAAMRGEGVVVDYTDRVLTLNGETESGQFVLTLDRKEGNLLQLSVPSQSLTVEFAEFTFLD